MERHGQMTTYEERIRIDELAIAGHTDPEIAEMMSRSVWTVRKWRRRVQHGGHACLQSTVGRPPRGPLSSFPEALASTIRQLRVSSPGWGPTTIRVALSTDPSWYDQPLPSRARIAAFLKHEGLSRRYLWHTTLVEPPRLVDPPPHGTWQVDAKDPYLDPSLGKVSLINVVDVRTHLKLESYPALAHSPGLASYQLALRRAFTFDHL